MQQSPNHATLIDLKDFKQFKLSEATLKAITDLGITEPTEIQAKTFAPLSSGKDLIGLAGTGTGKTIAFAVPAIERLDNKQEALQVLVLCPTRELAVQVAKQFKALLKYQDYYSVVSIYGGQSISIQLKALRSKPQIIVGTPGRVMDHMRRSSIKINKVSTVILDEADQMIDMGFREDMELILEKTSAERQTVMFSATMNKNLLKLSHSFLKNPVHIDVTKEHISKIDQVYVQVSNQNQKLIALKSLIEKKDIKSALIFCNTKIKVDELVESLTEIGVQAAGIHGDMNQSKRDRAMNGFRKEQKRFLVATDVAARGIDVKDVEAVFNYDIPRFGQDYTHRIGRTGRAGKSGLAISLVHAKEINSFKKMSNDKAKRIEVDGIYSREEKEKSPRRESSSSFGKKKFTKKPFPKSGARDQARGRDRDRRPQQRKER